MKIILVGPPASGKGTLAKFLSQDFKLPHISTGEIFRENIKNNTELGKKVKSYLDSAVLVPDEITMDVVKKRIAEKDCVNGYILDGFPRNTQQAKLFDKIVKADVAVHLDVGLKEIEDRILGRKNCSVCGRIYNTRFYKSDTCECGGKLFVRNDDNIDTIRKRYYAYEKETVPIISHYKSILKSFSGKDSPETTYQPIKEFLLKEAKKFDSKN